MAATLRDLFERELAGGSFAVFSDDPPMTSAVPEPAERGLVPRRRRQHVSLRSEAFAVAQTVLYQNSLVSPDPVVQAFLSTREERRRRWRQELREAEATVCGCAKEVSV